jgi:hypothetical protein
MPSTFKMRSQLRKYWKEENDKERNKYIPQSNENPSPKLAPDAQNRYNILKDYNSNNKSASPKRKTRKRKIKGGYKKNTRRRLR